MHRREASKEIYCYILMHCTGLYWRVRGCTGQYWAEKRMKGNKNVIKTVQSFFYVELQYLKSSSGGHLSERKRAGHVKQKTRLKILCLFCACYGKKHFQRYNESMD